MVKVRKEAASDLVMELLKQVIDQAPEMGARFLSRKKVR